MKNVKELPKLNFTEKNIDNLQIVNPVEFMSEEQNLQVLEEMKERLRYALENANNPNAWFTNDEVKAIIQGWFENEKV